MAKDYAKGFYNSSKWKKVRKAYLSMHPYCERCEAAGYLMPAQHVHHKCYISEKNINDYNVTLNMDNLEALCHDCHTKEHHVISQVEDNLMFDSNGQLIKVGGHL